MEVCNVCRILGVELVRRQSLPSHPVSQSDWCKAAQIQGWEIDSPSCWEELRGHMSEVWTQSKEQLQPFLQMFYPLTHGVVEVPSLKSSGISNLTFYPKLRSNLTPPGCTTWDWPWCQFHLPWPMPGQCLSILN